MAVNPWLRVFAPFAVGYYLSYLLRNVNAVIAPELVRETGASSADLGLLTSAYLLAFGAFQLPLGLLLDRYGPRRVEAALLMIAAAGSVGFGLAGSMTELALARGLIGLGVSACLMASFKAFSIWFPAERQPSLNAAVMAAGGLGALSATTPLAWAMPIVGWRGVFFALAGLAVVVALLIATTPERPSSGRHETLRQQLGGLATIVGSRAFWRFAPMTTAIVGGFMAIQGLWAVPWLTTVNGVSRDQAAFHLLLTSGAMLIGFVGIATLVVPLRKRGIGPERLLKTGMGLGLLVMVGIVGELAPSPWLWFLLGLVFAVGNLAYALLSAHFPLELAGRANTALNLGSFIGAFGIQWGFGALVDALQAGGVSAPDAYRMTMGVLVVLQVAGYAWFVIGGRPGSTAK